MVTLEEAQRLQALARQQNAQQAMQAAQATGEAPAGSGGFIGRTVQAVSSAITGEGQFDEDLPEFGAVIDQSLRKRVKAGQADSKSPDFPDLQREGELMRAVSLPTTVPAKVSAVLRVDPDAEIRIDDFGNIIVKSGEVEGFLNKPGVSFQDVHELSIDALMEAPLIVFGGSVGKAILGTVGKVLGVSTGAAGGSVARETTAQDISPAQELSFARAMTFAAAAGIGEIALPIFGEFLHRVVRSTKHFNPATGKLTKAGRDALTRAGFSPDDVTEKFLRNFKKTLNKADDSAEAARLAQAQAQPEPVPLSRGDVTRQASDQALESAAARGGMGEGAERAVKDFRETQQVALQKNVQALEDTIAPGNPGVTAVGEGTTAAQAKIAAERAALKGQTDAAFRLARQTQASVSFDTVRNVSTRMQAALNQNFNPLTAPKTFGTVKAMRDFAKKAPGKVTSVTVRALENQRSTLSKITRGTDPVEAAAARKAIETLDGFMDEAFEGALVRGDVGALQAWKNARTLRFQLFKKFEEDKLLASIIEEADGTLKLTPREASNKLFTANALGAKQGSVNTLKRMKTLLGAESREWQGLKQEAFLRLLLKQGSTDLRPDLSRSFSGEKFASAVESAMKQSKDLMETLFSKGELAAINNFKQVALIATSRVPGAVNFSNTATVGAQLLDKFGFLGREGRDLVRGFMREFLAARKETAAIKSIRQPLGPRQSALPPGAGGTAGALTQGQTDQ